MRSSILRTFFGCLLLLAPIKAQQIGSSDLIAKEMESAVARVKEIVNQPVTKVPMGPSEGAALFKPGWFHSGALVPDFDHVDIRATQECAMYARWPYVTSDINPGIKFIGSELEFNSMTKFFYTDRSVPKKKLTESEMLEVNDLYRCIGKCLREMKEAHAQGTENPVPDAQTLGVMAPLVLPLATVSPEDKPQIHSKAASPSFWGVSPWNLGALGLVLVLLLAWIQVHRNRS